MHQKSTNKDQKISISREEINELPLKAFEGKITLVDDAKELPAILKEINKHEVVGFDTETRPSFHKGQFYKVSLVQLALPTHAFLIRISHTGISKEIISLFENENILKAGVAIRDDIKALQRLQPFEAKGFIDVATMAKSVGLEVESVKKLAALLLGFRISKSAQTSNWEAPQYTEKQLSYAATDAWVCLELYKNIRKIGQ